MTIDKEQAVKQVRQAIMHAIHTHLKLINLPQKEAAKLCGITQPRLCTLLQSRVELFSTDALVRIAAALNIRINIVPEQVLPKEPEDGAV